MFPRSILAFLAVCGADFLRFIIASRRIFFNPVFAEQAHKSGSALRSPDAPAGSARQSPAPTRLACRSVRCAPAPRPALQGEIGGVQFWVWERRGLLATPLWAVFGFPVCWPDKAVCSPINDRLAFQDNSQFYIEMGKSA